MSVIIFDSHADAVRYLLTYAQRNGLTPKQISSRLGERDLYYFKLKRAPDTNLQIGSLILFAEACDHVVFLKQNRHDKYSYFGFEPYVRDILQFSNPSHRISLTELRRMANHQTDPRVLTVKMLAQSLGKDLVYEIAHIKSLRHLLAQRGNFYKLK